MISEDVKLEKDVVIHHPDLVNLYGCTVGAETRIGTFVEIQKGAAFGSNATILGHVRFGRRALVGERGRYGARTARVLK